MAEPTPLIGKLPPVHPEGRKFVAIAAVICLLFFWLNWEILGWLMVGLTIWVAAFFRDPTRVTPDGADLVISPADGVISHIEQAVPPVEFGLGETPLTRVSVFMSVFDVHINRAPMDGIIERIQYIPGKFLNATLDKASTDNERQNFLLRLPGGGAIVFTQIAGLIARRILAFVKEGDSVQAGERIGLIRFGSRVDVYLPVGTVPAVLIGQRAVAGETILARIGQEVPLTGTPR
jgi:phosphatidylserine decarboxylase